MADDKRKATFPPEMVEQALQHPGGWVYEIAPGYDPMGTVPPHAIKGAWKVDESGKLTGEFTPNPNFRAEESN
jgi:hypothetical protein